MNRSTPLHQKYILSSIPFRQKYISASLQDITAIILLIYICRYMWVVLWNIKQQQPILIIRAIISALKICSAFTTWSVIERRQWEEERHIKKVSFVNHWTLFLLTDKLIKTSFWKVWTADHFLLYSFKLWTIGLHTFGWQK